MIDETRLQIIMDQVKTEFIEASQNFGSFHNYHEGYAVLKEEVDELWDEIKGQQRTFELRTEARQVAAMAIRFLYDCT